MSWIHNRWSITSLGLCDSQLPKAARFVYGPGRSSIISDPFDKPAQYDCNLIAMYHECIAAIHEKQVTTLLAVASNTVRGVSSDCTPVHDRKRGSASRRT